MSKIAIIKTFPVEILIEALKKNNYNISATLRELKLDDKNSYSKKYISALIIEHKLITRYNRNQRIEYSLEDIKNAAKRAMCYSDICREIGLTTHGANIKYIQKIIKNENIDISHFSRSAVMLREQVQKYSHVQMFAENSLISRGVIKRNIIKNNLIPYECLECNIIDEYNGKPIKLTLEHKNGINNDHRLENLCFLCPNCQSQTLTFCGRNTRMKLRTNFPM